MEAIQDYDGLAEYFSNDQNHPVAPYQQPNNYESYQNPETYPNNPNLIDSSYQEVETFHHIKNLPVQNALLMQNAPPAPPAYDNTYVYNDPPTYNYQKSDPINFNNNNYKTVEPVAYNNNYPIAEPAAYNHNFQIPEKVPYNNNYQNGDNAKYLNNYIHQDNTQNGYVQYDDQAQNINYPQAINNNYSVPDLNGYAYPKIYPNEINTNLNNYAQPVQANIPPMNYANKFGVNYQANVPKNMPNIEIKPIGMPFVIKETCLNCNKKKNGLGQMGFGHAGNFNQMPNFLHMQKLKSYPNFFQTQFNKNNNLNFGINNVGLNNFSNLNNLGNIPAFNSNFNVPSKFNNFRSFPMTPFNKNMKGFGLNNFNSFLKPSLNTFGARLNPLYY